MTQGDATQQHERVIITGASPSYESSLLALIGSLNCNWPNHPNVVVYDLGMTSATINRLDEANIKVRRVPEFCDHWRGNFTWKPWCFHDAPGKSYLWLDSGVCVLRPMDEVFTSIERLGYFAVALYNHPVGPSVPVPLQKNLKLSAEQLDSMISISSGIHGFLKQGPGKDLLQEGLDLAMTEENMKATAPPHRHDQALLTLLLNKHFGTPTLADYHIYAHHEPSGPGSESRQKIWVHRKKMLESDKQHFAKFLSVPGPPFRPVNRIPSAKPPGWLKRLRIKIAKMRGRCPGEDYIDLDSTILDGFKG